MSDLTALAREILRSMIIIVKKKRQRKVIVEMKKGLFHPTEKKKYELSGIKKNKEKKE